MLPASYTELLRYDGAAIQRARRDKIIPCAIQSRDVGVIRDVRRYKFLTAPQLLELHWPGGTPQVGRRRLAKLFDAGCLERFRPVSRTGGSFPWTYQLGAEGHRLLREIGELQPRARFELRTVYDYRYVLHEIHTNAWALAWRRLLGPTVIEWRGETEIEPPRHGREPERLDDERTIEGLRDPRARLVRPDAVLEVARQTTTGSRLYLIEYDRTRRVDKNYEKFLRYDALLCWWWRRTSLAHYGVPPFVVFVCQDEEHLETFLDVADRELTGHLWHSSDGAQGHEYPGRDHLLFVVELHVHAGNLTAWQVPHCPSGPVGRETDAARSVLLPGGVARPPVRLHAA